MDNPRPEKVAVVDEVRERLDGSVATVVTEYRGLTVAELAELRRTLGAAGGDYKVFKNTLVRLAVAGSQHEPLQELLVGPTGIAFVKDDVSAVAKTLRDFSRSNPHLVVKGGFLDGSLLGSSELTALADLPSREVLLGRLAGAIAAPLQQFAGLLQAAPRSLAYGLAALLEKQGGAPAESAVTESAEAEVPTAEAEAEVPEVTADAAPAEPAAADEPADETEPAADAADGAAE